MGDEWKKVSAEIFCKSVRDGTHDSPKPVKNGQFLVTSRHISGSQIDLSNAYLISQNDFDAINKRSKVDQWDVLISMIGTVGRPCLIREKPNFAIKNIGLFKSKGKIQGKWLYYYLLSPVAQQIIREHSRGTTQQYIPLGALRSLPVIFPNNINEMDAIINILGTLDDKIELNRKMNENLEGIARAIFKSWFVDFDPVRAKMEGRQPAGMDAETAALFPDGFEGSELGKIPKGWEKLPLDKVAINDSETFDFNKHSEVVFINTGDVFEGDFLHKNLSTKDVLPGQAKKIIRYDDILLSEIRPANKRYAYVDFDPKEYVVSTKFMIIRSLGDILPKLLYRILTNKETLNEFQIVAESRSGTFPQITFSSISYFGIILPPMGIQLAYQKLVKLLDAKKSVNKAQSNSLSTLRDTLLPKLISGQLRIPDAEKMVEDAA